MPQIKILYHERMDQTASISIKYLDTRNKLPDKLLEVIKQTLTIGAYIAIKIHSDTPYIPRFPESLS